MGAATVGMGDPCECCKKCATHYWCVKADLTVGGDTVENQHWVLEPFLAGSTPPPPYDHLPGKCDGSAPAEAPYSTSVYSFRHVPCYISEHCSLPDRIAYQAQFWVICTCINGAYVFRVVVNSWRDDPSENPPILLIPHVVSGCTSEDGPCVLSLDDFVIGDVSFSNVTLRRFNAPGDPVDLACLLGCDRRFPFDIRFQVLCDAIPCINVTGDLVPEYDTVTHQFIWWTGPMVIVPGLCEPGVSVLCDGPEPLFQFSQVDGNPANALILITAVACTVSVDPFEVVMVGNARRGGFPGPNCDCIPDGVCCDITIILTRTP